MKKFLLVLFISAFFIGCKKDDAEKGSLEKSIIGTWMVTSVNTKIYNNEKNLTKDTTIQPPFRNGDFESLRFTSDSLYIKFAYDSNESKGLQYLKTDTSWSFKNYSGMTISYKIDNFNYSNFDFSIRNIRVTNERGEDSLGTADVLYKSKRK